MTVWAAPAVDWNQDENDPAMVKVTNLHWRATLTEGELTASSYGATPDDGNRVYTLAALEAVPESAVIKWVTDALGAEEVARIEQALADDIAEQKTPTSGTVYK